MTRIFRWGYILPRLILILLIVLFSEYGAAWLIKQAAISSGQSAVGARVEIASAEASIFKTQLALRDIKIANPGKPMQNLVEASSVELDFDSDGLLRKKAVVSRGAIRGLRFGTERTESGQLPDAPAPEESETPAWVAEATGAAGERAKAWLDNLGHRFSADVKQQFESVRVARELREKWPNKYDELAAAADRLQADADLLKAQIKEARANPLRNAQFLQSLPQRIDSLKQQLTMLTAEAQSLPDQIQADRQRVQLARRQDEKLIRESLAMENIDSAELSNYLLGEEVAGPMRQLIGWLRWARQMMPAKTEHAAPVASRGVDVLFAGLRPRPDLLVRSLDLSGTAQVAGMPVELAGTLTDFTTQPLIHGKPAELAINTSGALPIQLRATIDRTGDQARDTLLADCRGVAIPATKLGGDGWFALAVQPSDASVSVSLSLVGDALSGDLQFVQTQVRAVPSIAHSASSKLPVKPLEQALKATLSRLPKIATQVDLSGTLDQPSWKLRSNLGPAVAEAMQVALRRTVDAQTDQLLAASQAEVNEQLAKFEQELNDAVQRVAPKLDGPASSLQQLAADAVGGSPLNRIGGKLGGSLFK